MVENISLNFLVIMRNFKNTCCLSGLTDSNKASTEECITSLRERIKNETEEDCLQVRLLSMLPFSTTKYQCFLKLLDMNIAFRCLVFYACLSIFGTILLWILFHLFAKEVWRKIFLIKTSKMWCIHGFTLQFYSQEKMSLAFTE